MRRTVLVLGALVVVGALGVGALWWVEVRRVQEIERLDLRFQPGPGQVDVRRANLESAPDVLAALDQDQVTLDRATSALLAVTDSGVTRCPRTDLLLPWTKEHLRLHCESASEYVLDWAARTVWADLHDALLARCAETPEELEFEDYRRTDRGFPRSSYDRHAELLADLQDAARIAATPTLCEEMLETLSGV